MSRHINPQDGFRDGTLKQVTATADRLKRAYHEEVCDGIDDSHRRLIGDALQFLPDVFHKEDLIQFFSKGLSESATKKLFKDLFSKGLIFSNSKGAYEVSIPSLGDFLIDKDG